MLVLLVACGYPSYYPNPGTLDLYVDTGVADDVPCGASVGGIPDVYVHFTNEGLDDLLVWEVDRDCRQDFELYLEAQGEGAVVHTAGTVLAVRSLTQELVDVVSVPSGVDRLDVVVP